MDVRASVLTSIRWTAGARLVGQLFSWGVTIWVMRLLAPSDYGLMAMATVVVSFLYLVNTLGLDAVLVQRENISVRERRQVFGVVILLNVAIFLALFLCAPLLASFFGEEELTSVVRTLGVRFLFLIFETLPQAALEREINLKAVSLVDLATLVIGGAVTLLLAYAGFGVWALVWGQLATGATRIVGMNLVHPILVRPLFDFNGVRALLTFGGLATSDRILWFLYSESDKFIGGRILGREMLGFYAVADHLAALPHKKISGLVTSVAFPAFSRLQTDRERSQRYFVKAFRVAALCGIPVFFGMSSIAPEIVNLVLGQKWAGSSLLLQVLALVMPLRMFVMLIPPALWGISRPEVSAGNYLIAALVMPVAFVVGSQWGPIGLALSWAFVFPLVFILIVLRSLAVVGVDRWTFFGALFRPAVAGAFMYVMVWLGKSYAVDGYGSLLYVLQLVLIGAISYVSALFVVCRQHLREAIDLVKG